MKKWGGGINNEHAAGDLKGQKGSGGPTDTDLLQTRHWIVAG